MRLYSLCYRLSFYRFCCLLVCSSPFPVSITIPQSITASVVLLVLQYCAEHKGSDVTCTYCTARVSCPRDERFCNGNITTVWTRRTSNIDDVRSVKWRNLGGNTRVTLLLSHFHLFSPSHYVPPSNSVVSDPCLAVRLVKVVCFSFDFDFVNSRGQTVCN